MNSNNIAINQISPVDFRSLSSLVPAAKRQHVQIFGVGNIHSKRRDHNLSAYLQYMNSVDYFVFADTKHYGDVAEASAILKAAYPNLKIIMAKENGHYEEDLEQHVDGTASVSRAQGDAGKQFLVKKEGLLTSTDIGMAAFLTVSLANQIEVNTYYCSRNDY